ncbi:alpha-1,2-mannosyltransferase ALG9 isoform X3 [Toxorhynchites rutilus septentrionalis]|uniref:alpha-1,2-mannosyltransferase ALG9 isoform X3 n=1 Tax=Toxorhynchites rutilus septentrionalis TaxID=329112 RepID=UPI00247963C5|nr:alpha-1,2-mannosyltransferase ALG9 isoform X3 [Toxorhynchites rutilus septentrionalis]
MLTGRYVAGVCECFHENCMVESLTYRDVTGRERDVYVVCESHLKLQRPYVFFSQRLDRLIDVNYSFASIIGCAVFVRLIIDFCRKYSINRLIERLSGITIHEPVILLYFEYNLVAEKIVTMKVFCCFLIIRLLSAFFLHITDCDETYNYWEPLHYLTQGKGLQTWEYSPEYGLRSYFYLLLHAVPSFLLKTILDVDAIIAFYATRCMLAVICSVMETILFKFLFPVYPLLTLCGAVSICTTGTIANYFAHVLRFDKKTYFHLLAKITNHVLKWCIFVLCASRLYSLYSNYHAPMRISLPLQKTSTEQNICVGNEWHRFPGSFFIPANYNLRFIRSHFNGMLPAYFSQSENGTTIIHSYFNNMNRANEYMLVNISNCDFLINFDDGKHYNIQDVEPNYSKDTVTWEIVKSLKFLNTKSSNKLYRAFYIPLLTPKYVNYGNYDLLKRKLLK